MGGWEEPEAGEFSNTITGKMLSIHSLLFLLRRLWVLLRRISDSSEQQPSCKEPLPAEPLCPAGNSRVFDEVSKNFICFYVQGSMFSFYTIFRAGFSFPLETQPTASALFVYGKSWSLKRCWRLSLPGTWWQKRKHKWTTETEFMIPGKHLNLHSYSHQTICIWVLIFILSTANSTLHS